MSALSHRLYRNLLTSLLLLVFLSGCQSIRGIDLNPFSQGAEEAADASPVPVAKPATGDMGGYPVRQPPPPPRDGMTQLPSTSGSATVQQGRSAIKLRPDAPRQYTVVKGDTLWDISGLFLQDPWYWPEIWQANPQIKNPHLIYPGDVLSLIWVDGQPRIVVNADSSLNRMSPQIRVLPLDAAIPTIPYDAIEGFLSKPRVMSEEEISRLPYILEIKESHIIAGSGFTVYTRGGDMDVGQRYNVMHIGEPLYDPETRNVKGYQAHYVGAGRITATGDPAKMFLNETTREVLRGDRLVTQDVIPAQDFVPSAPDVVVEGIILSVLDGVSLIGQYQIVVLNRGTKHGLKTGNVLTIMQSGETVHDRFARRGFFGRRAGPAKVVLPDETAGRLMVFRTQDDISYALVMSATSEIKVHDKVVNPL